MRHITLMVGALYASSIWLSIARLTPEIRRRFGCESLLQRVHVLEAIVRVGFCGTELHDVRHQHKAFQVNGTG